MSAIFDFPLSSETLAEDELTAITGTPMAALQREWLDKNGWAHHLNRAGKPIVGRLYARLRMAGLRPETFVHHGGWTPDFQSIN